MSLILRSVRGLPHRMGAVQGARLPGTRCHSVAPAIHAQSAVCYLEELKGADEGISIINLDRPKAKNAISVQFLTEFRQCIDKLRFESQPRVVILRSLVDGVFCAGADLKERATMTTPEVRKFLATLRQTFCDLEALPVPTIASVDGAALGGGLEMALCCDMRVGGSKSKLGLTETRLAIIPGAGGTQRLSRLIGLAKAKELIYTAQICNATQAQSIGILNHAVPEESSYEKALEISRNIIPRGPVAIRMAKQALDCGVQLDLTSGLTVEQLCYAQVLPTTDRIEGLTAFREKRTPIYKGE
ncbi:enoyl-CoA hydratase [Dimargaris cristalligena]|uniref:Enoyl-CoA hydratase n=1 Tax=Dimargaris cristalligena TaxID=215637 RepID=A0A4Q0A2I1_9FUNG|nr:enoyl-CoA hydratase [Dimargaris cristalligena]|eukprot:RKP40038.1 enoyl-CoA hydratase [Dimargaris cristalligena]